MAYELFFDGFGTYASIPELLKYGYTETVNTSGNSLPNTSGRRGGSGLKFVYNSNLVRPITASTHVVVGAAIYADALTLALQLRNGTTIHAAIDITALTPMTLYTGGATIGTSAASYPYKTHMFVEIGVSVGAQGTCEVRVNGSSVGWFPLATLDTQNGATATINNIKFGQVGNLGSHIIDDFYVTYGNELVWLGDSRVDRLLLTGNTATQDWTPSSGNAWERLNAGDGYVESAVDEATSFFELADLSYNPLAIHGVKVGGLIKKSDAGYREACLLTNSDGTITETSPLALSTDTLGIITALKTDPATGLAWNLPGVQALQPGLRVKV